MCQKRGGCRAHSPDFTYRDHIDEGRFARVLQPDQRQLHFLFPEEALEPVQKAIQHRNHLAELVNSVLWGDEV